MMKCPFPSFLPCPSSNILATLGVQVEIFGGRDQGSGMRGGIRIGGGDERLGWGSGLGQGVRIVRT